MIDFKPFIIGFACGVRDSFLGLILLFNIDQDDKSKSSSSSKYDGSGGDRPPGRRGTRPESSAASKRKKKKILPMMGKCCFLNGGLLLLSMMLFESYIVPAVTFTMTYVTMTLMNTHDQQSTLWTWLEPTMKYTFKYLWVIPLFWLCKLLNCFWFVEIADVAYRQKHGRPVLSLLSSKDSMFKVLSKTMADFLFSILVETLFLVQSQIVGLVPVLGPALSFFHMSLLYSLYAFEYTWMNLGWGVVRRIGYVENYWPYFLGFGMVLTTATTVPASPVISACIFGITFPVFILSGLEVKPYEVCEFPLRMFSFVIWLTNKIFLLKTKRTSKAQHTQQQQQPQHPSMAQMN